MRRATSASTNISRTRTRYERADEFADVVTGLWDSLDEDAFLRDKASGRYFDPDKRHVLDHRGAFFKVRGPLNVARSPQGHPVIVQAGSSEAGRELAARTAEVIFTAQQTLDDAVAFYADVKGRMARYGRHPDALKIMPGVMPIVGRTEAEARAKFDELQALIDPVVGLAMVSTLTGGFDLSAYPLDGPIPELPETNASKSRQTLMIELARRENLTIRELYRRIAGARGHWQLVGTPAQIADALEERFVNYGADGFNVMPALLPDSLNDFIELVLPELRRRGLLSQRIRRPHAARSSRFRQAGVALCEPGRWKVCSPLRGSRGIKKFASNCGGVTTTLANEPIEWLLTPGTPGIRLTYRRQTSLPPFHRRYLHRVDERRAGQFRSPQTHLADRA